MFCFFAFILFAYKAPVSDTAIDLTALEIFQPEYLAIHKLGENYLFSTILPNESLSVVSPKGQRHHIYQKEGRGPHELQHHSVLAIAKNKIYVYSLSSGLLIFDHKLNLLPDLKISKHLTSDFATVRPEGVLLNDKRIMIVGHPYLDHHLFYFDLADAFKKPGTLWFPSEPSLPKVNEDHGIKNEEACRLHNGYLFTYLTDLTRERDRYHILVYQPFEGKWRIVMELGAEVTDFDPWLPPLIAVVNRVLKTPTGFLVQVSGAHPDPQSLYDHTMYYDFFDQKGVFQKRIAKANHALIAVKGSDQLFEVIQHQETDYLVPFLAE